MTRSAFGHLHPAVSYGVGGSVLLLAFLTKDPVSALLLGLGALLFDGECFGAGFVCKRLALFLGLSLIGAVTNPLISHRGVTVLFYIGNGAVTAEAALYGAVSCAMLADVILWCEALYRALPGDAALYFPGKILPRTTLVFSMAIRFVPRLLIRFKEARAAQRAFHPDDTLRHAFSAFQTGVALTLEECCEIAAGMEERGWGTGRRTSYSLYRFRGRDAAFTALTLALTACTLTGYFLGAYRFTYYPGILRQGGAGAWYAFPALLAFLPAITERKEKVLWRFLQSKT